MFMLLKFLATASAGRQNKIKLQRMQRVETAYILVNNVALAYELKNNFQVFMFLYDNDVVTEEAFMVWNSKPAVSYFALLSPQEIRTKVITSLFNCCLHHT